MSDSPSGGKGNWDLFFAASGSDIPERAPDSSRFYEDHAVCRYTGVPAFAEIDGGLISAGYGSRYDFTLFVFLKGRPDDLPEGASVSDEILENWIKDGVIAVYQNDQGVYPLTTATMRTAFEGYLSWARQQIAEMAGGRLPPSQALSLFLSGDNNLVDPMRLAFFAAMTEAITKRPVCVEDIWTGCRRPPDGA